jgi:cytochrome c-type biogenesis protein CcsB
MMFKSHKSQVTSHKIKYGAVAFAFTVALSFLTFSAPLFAASDPVIERLGEIPVQHSGRVKPFESFAREATLYITGRFEYRGMSPTQLAWEWISNPEKWDAEPFIPASFPALVKEFGVKEIHGRVSPAVVFSDSEFMKKTEAALALRDDKEKLTLLDQKRIEVYEKALYFRSIGEGVSPGWVAQPDDPRASWFSLQALMSPEGQAHAVSFYSPEKLARVMETLKPVLLGFREKGRPEASSVLDWSAALNDLMVSRSVLLPREVLHTEVHYLRLHPFSWAWPCYLAAVLLGVLAGFLGTKKITPLLVIASLAFFLTGLGLHSYGFYLRCLIAGRPPVSNMYESIVWVSWAAAFFALILSLSLKAPMIRHFAGLVATLALILAQKFPTLLDPSITPLVPVLRSNLWLTVHVLTITMSYGAFMLAWGLGHGALFRFVLRPTEELANVKLSQYTYRSIQIGVILLAAGTVLGGVWANYSWGRFWGWDPKETWALIALLGYILVLHGRFTGWLKPFEFAAGAVIAFLGVVMAWYGVNYVLAAGLHSYGFGGGGSQYVGAAALADMALVAGLILMRSRRSV